MRRLLAIPGFFAVRVALALALLKLSATFLPVTGFAVLSQLVLFASLLNLVAIGGTQNGLIRQAAIADHAVARRAAWLLWAALAPVLLLAIACARVPISQALTGTPAFAGAVVAVAALTLGAGPAQIWCSILSGRQRTVSSVAAQAAGLAAGTGLAACRIVAHDPGGAAIGFAGGAWLTMLLSYRLLGPATGATPPRAAIRAELRVLLHYSGALAATVGASSLLMFGLRPLYRDHFGAVELGYWLAATRISDLSTQLLGLFMIQFHVPRLAAIADAAERRGVVLRSWALAAAVMAGALAMFSLLAYPLVHLLLSDAFLPAIPLIRTYMAGDLLRVWASLAMFTAFARGRPLRYAAIEVSTLGLFAAITAALVLAGDPRAPALGYVGAYAVTALLVTIAFARGAVPAASRTALTA